MSERADKFYDWLAWKLPKRLVSYCVLRVINEVNPLPPIEQSESYIHPDEIGWYEALGKFDPLNPPPVQLKLVGRP